MPSSVHEEVMNESRTCSWKCLIGNAKKWKIGSNLSIPELQVVATRTSQDEVRFIWESGVSFSDLLVAIGKIPLPPYLKREVEKEDQERYQTVYSKMKGAVAAPTAGLHFTKEILGDLSSKEILVDYLTLHVSAGTFQPIKVSRVEDHPMHNEQIWISRKNIENLLHATSTIAVGTTSMRTLESLYWYGTKLRQGIEEFMISKSDPYSLAPVPRRESLEAILNHMHKHKIDKLGGHTEIFLYPGYDFKLCDGLITNYHMPGSTLILLVAAFIGKDWRYVYQEALKNGYQFLSYGDSSLLLRKYM